MGFRGQAYVFDSPAGAVAGLIARLGAGVGREGGWERCGLDAARGRVLAEAVRLDRDSPGFDHSAMDGYAVRAGAAGVLRVSGEVVIGRAPPALPEGAWAVRVVTGGAIPEGAEAVVRREDTVERGGEVELAPGVRVRGGEHIRRRGENGRAGSVVLEAGSVLSAAGLGALAAVGMVEPRVHRRLRVAVVTTGDELVEPGVVPGVHEVRNSNAAVVAGVVGARAWACVAWCVHVRDEAPEVARAVREAVERADAVVLTGGVSVGPRDHVRGAVEEAGGEVVFHGLPQKPGKPMLGAVVRRGGGGGVGGGVVPVFGLPGNPVSAMVTCTRVVMPVLGAAAGVARWPGALRVRVANEDGKGLELWHHRLVRVRGDGAVELVEGRGSGDVVAGGGSDGFIEVPPGGLGAGESAAFYPWAV